MYSRSVPILPRSSDRGKAQLLVILSCQLIAFHGHGQEASRALSCKGHVNDGHDLAGIFEFLRGSPSCEQCECIGSCAIQHHHPCSREYQL